MELYIPKMVVVGVCESPPNYSMLCRHKIGKGLSSSDCGLTQLFGKTLFFCFHHLGGGTENITACNLPVLALVLQAKLNTSICLPSLCRDLPRLGILTATLDYSRSCLHQALQTG